MSFKRLKCLTEEPDIKMCSLGRDQIGVHTKTKFLLAKVESDHLQIQRTISSKGVVGGFQISNS